MATELGQAYIQIMPSAKGISGNIEKELSGGEAGATKAGGKMGGALKLGLIAAVVGIGAVVGKALMVGGELQQNLGGTEAVFGNFAKNIQSSASEAYKNMGMSASDYMATANKMGSLFQGSGLSQQKSLDMTSAAMQRAADVASVMGVDTSMAMESIAGAAKGNMTMMDNLGVSMNATSLQAYALEKGINFEWNTASQAEKSELAMKMFMDRTSQYAGNFAKESSETFSGSLGAMKSSFQDTLAALSTGEGLGLALQNLGGTVVTFAQNLIPMISNIVKELPAMIVTLVSETGPQLIGAGLQAIMEIANGIGQALPTLFPMAYKAVLSIVDTLITNIPMLLDAGMELIIGLAEGYMAAIPIMLEKVPEIINSLITALLDRIPFIVQTGVDLLVSLIDELPTIISTLMEAMPVIIDNLVSALTDCIPYIIQSGIDLLTSLVDALPEIITTIVAVLPTIVDSIIKASDQLIPLIIDAGIDLLTALVDALPVIIKTIVKVLPTIIDSIIKAILGNIPLIINAGLKLLSALVGALPEIIMAIVGALPDIIDSVCSAIIDNIPLIVAAGVSLFTMLIGDLPLIISKLVAAMPAIIDGIIKALGEGLKSFKDMGGQLLAGLGDGISDAVGGVVRKAQEAAARIVQTVKDSFGIRSPSKVFYGFGENLDKGLANGISGNLKPISKAMDDLGSMATRSFESDIAMNASSLGAGWGSNSAASNGGPGNGGVTQTVNIYSPTALSPSETARQNKRALQELALQF